MIFQAHIIRIVGLCLALGFITALAGCSSWSSADFKTPEVRLLKVEVVKAKLLKQQFNLRFRIDNPNSFDLPVSGMEYVLYLDDIQLASGESNVSVDVPAYGHRNFEIPVNTNLWRHLRQIIKSLDEPETPVPYRLTGSIKTGWFFGQSVHIARNGEIIPGDFIAE